MISRRGLLGGAAASLRAAPRRKNVAAICTVYRRNSHADVIAGRLLEGYDWDGVRRPPAVRVATMYVDQTPADDMSRAMAAKHDVEITKTVARAIRPDTEGVVLIGEHGEYPLNELGQKLYPRYELFRQVAEAFRARGRSAPVYADKHLSVEWDKAKWMCDEAKRQRFALMAGSSLPVAWRKPPLELPLGTRIDRAVAAFYGDVEAYGFHALETLECMVERRRGGETGIAAVQAAEGPAVWQWTDSNPWAKVLLDHALQRSATRTGAGPRETVKAPVLFVVDYASGLKAAVYILNGHIRDCVFAADTGGRVESTLIWLQPGRPFSHFSALTHYIERFLIAARPVYPVERTLLTTGALAALMKSRHEGGKRIETGWLGVRYRATKESLFARGPVPPLETP